MLKAIETKYKGYRFRSRLEARWAVFFDAMKINWDYEPEGFDLGSIGFYLPDFWLPDNSLWIEIKGQAPTKDERVKAEYLARGSTVGVILVHGTIGDEKYDVCDPHNFHWIGYETTSQYPIWCDLAGHMGLHSLNDINDCNNLRNSYERARSARFEHGEQP